MKTLSESVQYLEWLEKFEIKRTEDSTFTPPLVYDAVRDWVLSEYAPQGWVVRPFYPGGDYQTEDYAGAVVIDNPPFSIMAQIVRWYEGRDIPYFLFAPHLTLFSVSAKTSVITDSSIEFANGAKLKIGFLTNLDPINAIRTAPELASAIKRAQAVARAGKPALPVYKYPMEVVNAATLGKIAGVDWRAPHAEASGKVARLESQRVAGKGIFGGGRIVSARVAAELKAAELKAAELKVARETVEWSLSDAERAIVEGLAQ